MVDCNGKEATTRAVVQRPTIAHSIFAAAVDCNGKEATTRVAVQWPTIAHSICAAMAESYGEEATTHVANVLMLGLSCDIKLILKHLQWTQTGMECY